MLFHFDLFISMTNKCFSHKTMLIFFRKLIYVSYTIFFKVIYSLKKIHTFSCPRNHFIVFIFACKLKQQGQQITIVNKICLISIQYFIFFLLSLFVILLHMQYNTVRFVYFVGVCIKKIVERKK